MGELAVLAERLAVVAGDDDDGARLVAPLAQGGEQATLLRFDERDLGLIWVAGEARVLWLERRLRCVRAPTCASTPLMPRDGQLYSSIRRLLGACPSPRSVFLAGLVCFA